MAPEFKVGPTPGQLNRAAEWTRYENTIAAILTLAVVGTSGSHNPDEVIQKWSEMVQRIRRIDDANPPEP